MTDWIQNFARMSEGKATRSTALQPMLWLCAVLLTALTGSAAAGAPAWLLVGLGSLAALVVLVILCAYVFMMLKRPDMVRSETFLIRRMELEQAAIGDNVRGIAEHHDQGHPQQLGGKVEP